MEEPAALIALASTALAGVELVSAAALAGWRGWLDLRRLELEKGELRGSVPSLRSRIEVADLKERLRRLEAIANGDPL